jgi:hypothetical protein
MEKGAFVEASLKPANNNACTADIRSKCCGSTLRKYTASRLEEYGSIFFCLERKNRHLAIVLA